MEPDTIRPPDSAGNDVIRANDADAVGGWPKLIM
jgi:hypothetical protein